MRTLVIGGGLVGTAVAHHCDGIIAEGIRWNDRQAAITDLRLVVREHCAGNVQWSIAWCAGMGVVGSTRQQLDHETALLATVLGAALDYRSNGRFLFTSSGGGIHAGSKALRINEETIPQPISEYGWAKYEQEHLVSQWARRNDIPTVIARPSNVYGPGQRLSKMQGFISQLLWRIIRDEPLTLSVPWNTQRDFIYADDAGMRMAHLLETVEHGVNVRIVASGKSVTLSHIVALARQITHVNPSVTLDEQSLIQPHVLRFGTVHEPFYAPTTLKQGMQNTWEYLLHAAKHPARGGS